MTTFGLLLVFTAAEFVGEWQTFTNTNFVNDLACHQEMIYLATCGGLQRFRTTDTTFLPALTNTDGLPANYIRCCAPDRFGNVWLGTDGGGLVVFSPEQERFLVYPPDRISALSVRCLSVAGDTVLVGSDNGAWLIDTRGTPLNFADDPLPGYLSRLASPVVLCIGVGRDFWFGSNNGILNRVSRNLDTVMQVSTRSVIGDTVKVIFERDDTVLVLSEWGIGRFNYENLQLEQLALFAQRRVVHDAADFNGKTYVAVEGELLSYDGTSFATEWQADCRALGVAHPGGMDDLLCVGCGSGIPNVNLLGNGLTLLRPSGVRSTFMAPGLASNMASSVVVDTAGEVFVTHYLTAGGFRGISHWRKDGSWVTIRDTIAHALFTARDSKNRIWFAHWGVYDWNGGLSVLYHDSITDSAVWKKYTWGPLDYRNVVAGFAIDRFDTKWVFAQTGELIAIDSNDRQVFFRIPGLNSPTTGGYEFAFDGRHRIWLGMTTGLLMLDTRGTLHDQSDDSVAIYSRGLQSSNITSVTIDLQGRPWVATSQGAAVLENGMFRLYTTANSGILSNSVSRVRTDPKGRVWFLTDRGPCIYEPFSGTWSVPDRNRGLIPNLSGRSGFYACLYLDWYRSRVLVGTQAGLSLLHNLKSAESSYASIRIYPNPYVQGRSQGAYLSNQITFDLLPDTVLSIEVYTLSGERVADTRCKQDKGCIVFVGSNQAIWDLKNTAGRDVSSGIYLVVVVTPKQRAVYRFAVVR